MKNAIISILIAIPISAFLLWPTESNRDKSPNGETGSMRLIDGRHAYYAVMEDEVIFIVVSPVAANYFSSSSRYDMNDHRITKMEAKWAHGANFNFSLVSTEDSPTSKYISTLNNKLGPEKVGSVVFIDESGQFRVSDKAFTESPSSLKDSLLDGF